MDLPEHGHSAAEIHKRLSEPGGRGHLRDAIYGGIDGAVTTFAIVAGVAGAGLSPFVIVALGLANVLADGFSMAAGNYSGTKAELDDARRLRAVEERHIDTNPEGEMRELREILKRKGLSGQTLEDATRQIASDRERWIATMLEGEYGLAPVDPDPMKAAMVTFGAFMVAGMVPLMPFLLGFTEAFTVSTVLTLMCFFGIGAAKSIWSLSAWWRSGLETLAIGGAAAGLAYVVGSFFGS